MRLVRGSWENIGKIGGWFRDCVVSVLERGGKVEMYGYLGDRDDWFC